MKIGRSLSVQICNNTNNNFWNAFEIKPSTSFSHRLYNRYDELYHILHKDFFMYKVGDEIMMKTN